jgi:hypothetical protein
MNPPSATELADLRNYKKISLASAMAYSIFGHIASVLSQGMKGPNGPIMAAVFIFTLMVLDLVLIKGSFNLKQVNVVNLVSIVAFYFFSIALPLFLTCPSPLSPLVALLAFSMVTFFSFSLIVYLIRRVLGLFSSCSCCLGKKRRVGVK